jgi:hypothetical protein
LKKILKKSNSPDPSASRVRNRWRRILGLTGFTLGLSALLVLFALLVVGLPPGLIRRITAQAQEAGIPLQVQSIRLSTHRGWVLSNVRLYSTSPDDLQPLLSAKKLYVMLWPVDWKKPANGGWRIGLYVKNLGVSLGGPWESTLPDDHPFRTIKKLDTSLIVAPGRIAVEKAALSWGGINILAHGNAIFSSGESEAQQSNDFGRRAAKIAEALGQLKCEQPPKISLIFNFNNVQPEEMSLAAEISAKGILWNNRVYKSLSGELSCRGSMWNLSALRLNQSDREQLVLHGAINLQSSNAQVSVENTLSATDLFNLLPEGEQSAVAQTGVKPYGRFDFTASAGPAPYNQLAEKVVVQVQQAHLKRHDITLDPLAFRLVRDGNSVAVKDLEARANGGPLSGSFEFDLGSKVWTARVQAQCDPILAGAYDKDLYDFILRFKFPNEQLKADLTLSQSSPDGSVVISGTLSADRFTCGGVPIDHLETFMVYSNQFLDLTPVNVVRDSVRFDGSVQVDLGRSLAFFNATNSFPPADIAHALAPDEHTILEEFRFDGPVLVIGSGQLDYGTWTNHDFKGSFSATNIGMGKIQASSFYSDIQGRGAQLAFTNSTIDLYGGRAEGSAEFDIFLEDGSAPYHINARIGQIELKQLLGQIGRSDYNYNRTRGQFSASLDLTADAKAGFWKSVRGGGQAKIENGLLADLPLFGGFSRLIQSAFSGFKLFSLTAFSADYELHDGAIWSDNAQLGGTLISARGRGNYSPEKGLNFIVAAEPLRQTGGQNKEWYQLQRLAAGATSPLFRLLEFQLEGPIDKPEWRFVNLPK